MCKCQVWYGRFRIHEHHPAPGVVLVRGTHPGTWIRKALYTNLSWAMWEGEVKWLLLPNIKSGKDYDPYRIGHVRLALGNHRYTYPHEVEVGGFIPWIEKAIPHLSPTGRRAVLQALGEGGTLADFHARATEIVLNTLGAEVKLPVWVPTPPPPEMRDPHGCFSSPWVLFTLACMGWRAHAAGVAMGEYLRDHVWGPRYAYLIRRYEETLGVEVGVMEIYPPPSVSFQIKCKGLETQYTLVALERG